MQIFVIVICNPFYIISTNWFVLVMLLKEWVILFVRILMS